MAIHPLALVHPAAKLGRDVEVGPFCTIEAGVELGDGCRLAARATIKAGVRMGAANLVEEGAVLGGWPQHLVRPANPGQIEIGAKNVFRENVTVHRPMTEGGTTRIGDGCLLMVGAHVAHDCTVANHVILTNNVMLGGHVQVGERACLGGGVAVHQKCRVGRLAMVGGMARVAQDVPPFVMIDGGSGLVVGLNRVGLRRAGLEASQIDALKEAYRVIYRSGLTLDQRLELLRERFAQGPASEFEAFLRECPRGFLRERRLPPGATIRPLHDSLQESETDEAAPLGVAPLRANKRAAG